MPAELLYPGEPGCSAAVREWPGGPPGACGAEPVGTVRHRYRYPRPHTARKFVCARHAEGHDVRPLDDPARTELARRRAVCAEAFRRRDEAQRGREPGA